MEKFSGLKVLGNKALSFNGKGFFEIHDKDSINTSFPNFLNIIEDLKK